MAEATGERTGLERWLFRVGYASAWMGVAADRVRERMARDPAPSAAEAGGVGAAGDDPPRRDRRAFSLESGAGPPAVTTAVGLLLAQRVRPRPVNWPRAILAGTIGTLVYDAESLAELRLAGRKFGTSAGGWRELLGASPKALLARYAAGIGMAAFYARYLHGRLPGPPVVQGLLYGLLESGTRSSGGAGALLGRLAPEVRVPSGYTTSLARDSENALQTLRRHLAFGICVGVVYRK